MSSQNGTFHQPHATLYGAIYTMNESYVIEVAKYLAIAIKSFTLSYDCMESYGVPNLEDLPFITNIIDTFLKQR